MKMETITAMLLGQATTMFQKEEAITFGVNQGVPLVDMEERLDLIELLSQLVM